MKIKPMENNKKMTYNNTRFNESTIGIVNSITSSNSNISKIDYASIALITIMHELGFLKHALIKESFEEAKKYIEREEEL